MMIMKHEGLLVIRHRDIDVIGSIF